MTVDLLFLTFLDNWMVQESSSSMFLISNRKQQREELWEQEVTDCSKLLGQNKEKKAWLDLTTTFQNPANPFFQDPAVKFKISVRLHRQIIHNRVFRKCTNELRGITEGSPQITVSSSLFFHSKWETVRPSEIERTERVGARSPVGTQTTEQHKDTQSPGQ